MEVVSVTYGNLDLDEKDEAAVDLVESFGGTNNGHYLYIFNDQGGLPELVARLQSGARSRGGLRRTEIRGSRLILEFADPERAMAECCSRGVVRATYRLEGNTFVASAPPVRDTPRSTELLPEPSVSADSAAVVLIRSNTEVWTRNIDGSDGRKIFNCPSRCRAPQFSPDRRSVFVVVDVSEDLGGIWKIDLSSGNAGEFIPNSARFRVIQRGPYPGYVIADQRTLTESDGTVTPYPHYAFFIFRPSGSRIGRIAEETADPDTLLMEYSQ